MYKIKIKRTIELKAPFEICNETNRDWTHFAHLHRKTHTVHRLIYRDEQCEIFLYKSRGLYPLPFFEDYVVFRDYPTPHSSRQVYLHVKTGGVHYLLSSVVSRGETTLMMSEFLFHLPSYWRLFPMLFLWLFKMRMGAVAREDNRWIAQMMRQPRPVEESGCAPRVPETFDPLKDLFETAWKGKPDANFEYYQFAPLDKAPY